MRLFAAVLAGLLLALPAAEARMHAPYRGHRIVAAVAPLDTFAAPTGAYSFRKLKSTYTGPAIRIRRASDNAETDINFLGFVPGLGAPLDVAAATAFCAATTCFAVTWYDQSGAGRVIGQTAPAGQPQLIFSCQNGLPCFRLSSGSMYLVSFSPITPATGAVTLNVVGRTSGAGGCQLMRETADNRILAWSGSQWFLQAASATIHTVTAAEGLWHTMVGVIAGPSSSIVRLDAAETSNSTGGTNVVAGSMGVVGAGATTCDVGEAAAWDNYVLTAAERAALANNQRAYWGIP